MLETWGAVVRTVRTYTGTCRGDIRKMIVSVDANYPMGAEPDVSNFYGHLQWVLMALRDGLDIVDAEMFEAWFGELVERW